MSEHFLSIGCILVAYSSIFNDFLSYLKYFSKIEGLLGHFKHAEQIFFGKNTAKSTVVKLQKSDAPKNKWQLTSRGGALAPEPPLSYAPGGVL